MKCTKTASGKHVWIIHTDSLNGEEIDTCQCLKCSPSPLHHLSRCVRGAKRCDYCGFLNDKIKK